MPLTSVTAPTEMQGGQCRRLADVLKLTQQMLEFAGEGDWEPVARLERRRRHELAACFGDAPAVEHTELVSEALAALLQLNEELMSKLYAAREDVLQKGAKQARARVAITEYRGVGGDRLSS